MNETKIKDLSNLFKSRGFNVVIGDIYRQQEIYVQYYRGDVNDFHNITRKISNGKTISTHKPSLNMGKKVAEDWTSLLFNEKVELIINNAQAQKAFDEVAKDNNFTDEMTNYIELAMVYGTAVSVEYISNDKVKYNFIYGDKIMVIGYENSTITDIAIIDEFEEDGIAYTHVMYHTYDGEIYRIEHEIYETKKTNKGLGKKTDLSVLFTDAELEEMAQPVYDEDGEVIDVRFYIDYESEPHFQIFKPAIANNFDVKSPMGMSVFGNALTSMNGIDDANYGAMRDELLARKKIFVDDEATKVGNVKNIDGSTSRVKYFDEEEDIYQVIKGMADQGNKSMEVFAPVYDSLPRIDLIKLHLGMISFKCGLGTDYYSFENGSVYVNEANIISSNSDTWRNRQKHLNRLKPALIGLMKSTMFLLKDMGVYGGELDNLEYDVMFDDDIITDDATVLKDMKEDSVDGFIPKWRYVMKRYKLNEEEAKEWLAEAEEESKSVFNFGEDEENEDGVDSEENDTLSPTEDNEEIDEE